MAKSKVGNTVAPKERINITYKPAVGDAKEDIELPFKIMVVGDFIQRSDERIIEDRPPINVNANNLDEVMEEQGLFLSFQVENNLLKNEDKEEMIDVNLDIKTLADLTPDSLIKNIPALYEVYKLREALQSLKGPLGNNPQMRKKIQEILSNSDEKNLLSQELGINN